MGRPKVHSLSYYARNSKKQKDYHARYVKTARGRFAEAKTSARKRGRVWSLSFEDWWSLVEDNECVYCGGPLEGAGLDRIDNALGYEIGNVVPCCRWNNFDRGILSFEEYWMVIAHRKSRWAPTPKEER